MMIQLPQELEARLREEALARKLDPTSLVREALQQYLGGDLEKHSSSAVNTGGKQNKNPSEAPGATAQDGYYRDEGLSREDGEDFSSHRPHRKESTGEDF